jgi:hypothetical protein
MSRLRIPLAPLAGGLALAVAAAVLITEVAHDGSGPMTSSVVLGAAGGALALWQHDHLGALVTADALLAGAVLLTLFGLGAVFVFPLLGLLVATVFAPAGQPQPKHLAPWTFASGFAAGPVRQSAHAIRKARDVMLRRLVRPESGEPEPLRRSA